MPQCISAYGFTRSAFGMMETRPIRCCSCCSIAYQPLTWSIVAVPLKLRFCVLAATRPPTASMQSVTTQIDDLNSETWFSWSPKESPTLTIDFSASPSCASRWIQNPYNTNEIWSDFLSFTSQGASGESSITTTYNNYVAPGYYANCRPSSSSSGFSPGICTSGQTVAWIFERPYQGTTLWVGGCCDRLLPIINGT